MTKQEEMQSKVEKVLVNLRPYLQRDGGDIEFVRFEEESSVVELRFLGNCKNCPLNMMTFRGGIERHLIYHIPEIRRIEKVN